MYKFFIGLILILAFKSPIKAQKITYADYDRKDSRLSSFEIIGKTGPNFLVFKFFRNQGKITAFNYDMQVVKTTECDFFPSNEDVFNVDFVNYADKAILVYQYQKKNIVYCAAANVDSNGVIIGSPTIIDTTKINFFASNKIYDFVKSDNKQHLAVVKVQRKNNNSQLCLVRFSPLLIPLSKEIYRIKKTEDSYALKEYGLNNKGNFACLFSDNKLNNNDIIDNASILTKQNNTNAFELETLKLPEIYIEDLRLKADNNNDRWIMSSFYSDSKRGNIEGLYIYSLPTNVGDSIFFIKHQFSNNLKKDIRGEASTKAALNDFLQRNLIIKKDGSIIISSESYYTRGGRTNIGAFNNGLGDNRNPNFNNSNLWQQDFYNFNNANFYAFQPFGNNNVFSGVRSHADNVVVTCYTPKGDLSWSQVINKNQFEDETENFISYNTFLINGQMLYFFNKNDQNNWLINVHSISPDGAYSRLPTLRSLDKGYNFIIRLAKQVNNKTIIVPCKYRNFICFAKIEY